MQPETKQTREQFIQSLFKLTNPDNFVSGKEAVKRLVKGIDKGADIIKEAFGPSGTNAIVEEFYYPFHRATNDGKLILKDIKLEDPVEQIGLNILREVADKSDKESGDGRKTSILLTQAIIKEGLKSKESPITIQRSLNEALPILLKEIDKEAKQITPLDLGPIAETATESKLLGALYQEIYTKIGPDGVIELDNSGTPETYYETTEGVKLLGCKFMFPYMANEDKERRAVYMNPYILVTKEKLDNLKLLDAILRQVSEKGKGELVIFCEDIDMKLSTALAFLHQGVAPDGKAIQPFKTLVIKMPTLWKDWIYEDLSKITGATILEQGTSATLKSFKFDYLGTCDKIITDKEQSIILGTKDIRDHISQLEKENTDESRLRISRLKTRTAILKIGANSESELSYIKGKALDGRNSSYLALQSGIVQGAGQSLYVVSNRLPDTPGGLILQEALRYPYKQICENLEVPPQTGFPVFDAAIVVKNALVNAVSVASTILTTKTVITTPKQ
jgi:chaperonin GroEL